MLNFSHDPPPDPRGNSLTLTRTPAGRQLRGIVTCSNLVGTPTHFFHGRTVPCDDTNCEACSCGVPWRWHGYVSLFGPQRHLHYLFEMTARAAEPLKTYRLAHGTLRGCLLSAHRLTSAPNARVIIETGVADLQSISLPPEPSVVEALSIIWNIPLPAITIAGTSKDVPHAHVSENPALRRFDPQHVEQLDSSGNGDDRTTYPE